MVAAGSLGVVGRFADVPAVGDHLGHGVFLTDRGENLQGVTYTAHTVEVDVLQAAPGDTDGDRQIDQADLQRILGADSFGNGTGFDWADGDFDGDTDVDNTDLMLVLATGLFQKTESYAAVAPEPTMLVLLAGGAIGLLPVIRRRPTK